MATFALVHGAWHGAWCWELLIPELEGRGHFVVAMDLPSEDRDATFSDYADTVATAINTTPDVVLVGHSMAGITVPLVALRQPVGMLVFLCALVPGAAGQSDAGGPPTHPDHAFDALIHYDDGSHAWPSAEAAAATLYQDCSPDLAARAFARLRRQQTALWDRLDVINRWPDVSVASIHCQEDRAISPTWSRWIARRRFGVDSIELPGGHSPMLSQPALLARTLIALSDRLGDRSL
jgi:pimeloyl-ACP methyl ester carboxylesterase